MSAARTVQLDDVQQAAERIAPWVHVTPVMTSELLDAQAGCELLFKCENLQKAGAFKARGAHNAVLSLSPEELGGGVATHSSGNHAAARLRRDSRCGMHERQAEESSVRSTGGTSAMEHK